jgi:putative heme-binding domain-containing protein
MNPDGSNVELVAGGMRNPLDIAFNRDGELFTFDADMERDVGTPWYMPTRVLHLVPGADFGWRRGTGRFPAWYPDTLPSVVDIGLSSPTGIFFGYGAKFPEKYRDALFISDWSYGRIIAVHLSPKGASYSGTQETFVSGRPMNVTDGCIGPDGAMWFITGGRGTQSGLYRVTFTGDIAPSTVAAGEDAAARARTVRHELERLGTKPDVTDAELDTLCKSLGSPDRFLSHAARTALESLPAARWRLSSLEGDAWLQGALAAIRTDRKDLRAGILGGLKTRLRGEPDAATLRILQLAFTRLGAAGEDERREWLELLDPRFPSPHGEEVNRELCKLLVHFKSPTVIARTAALLRSAEASGTLVHYPLFLRYVKDGWTLDARRAVFDALNRAEKMNGASTFFKVIQDIRSEIAASLTADEARELAAVILPRQPVRLSPHALPGHSFRNWKMEDLTPMLDRVSAGRSFESAKAALVSAQCVLCHRVATDATLPAGVIGPDLSQVSSRFNRRDLLDQILNPSKVIDEKYRNVTVTLASGNQVTGAVESEDDERLVLRPSLFSDEKVEIGKSMIKERAAADISPMPAGLLSPLKADQILDILAWFESGGDPKHKVFH